MACGIAGAAYITTGQPAAQAACTARPNRRYPLFGVHIRLRVVSCAPAYRDPASAPAEHMLRMHGIRSGLRSVPYV